MRWYVSWPLFAARIEHCQVIPCPPVRERLPILLHFAGIFFNKIYVILFFIFTLTQQPSATPLNIKVLHLVVESKHLIKEDVPSLLTGTGRPRSSVSARPTCVMSASRLVTGIGTVRTAIAFPAGLCAWWQHLRSVETFTSAGCVIPMKRTAFLTSMWLNAEI